MTAIIVTCSNGHRLEAQAGLAGSSLPCPACGEMVMVPQLECTASASDLTLAYPASTRKSSPAHRWLSLPLRLGRRLSVGVARVVLLTLLTLVVLWILFVRGGGQQQVIGKLTDIGRAFQQFHASHRMFAFPRLQDMNVLEPNRRPQPTALSWRVHLLPFLEHQALYDQFHLDEPWDSPHNLTLIEHMPEVYRLSGGERTTTRFRVLTGPNMLFGQQKPPTFGNIPDGTRSTILAVVVDADSAVTWTQPDDLTLDPQDPLAALGKISGRYIATVAVDGHPLMLPADIEAAKFHALATPRGKEIIDGEAYRREFAEANLSLLPALLKQLVGQ